MDEWRERTCEAKPSARVPPHVTLVFPFVPAARVDDALVAELRVLFARFDAFEFTLARTERFPRVLYLAPEPAEPFVALSEALFAAYKVPREFEHVTPHLTVAQGEQATLDAAERDVAGRLPLRARAEEALLLVETEPSFGRFAECARLPLG